MLRREVEGNTIKSRGESHSRGWWWWWRTPPRRVGREQGGGSSWLPGAPARRAHTNSRSPRERRATTILSSLGGGVRLAATWDHLGFFPSHTSGVAGRWQEKGWAPGVCAGFALAASGGGRAHGSHPPAPRELRSVAAPDQSLRRPSPWQLQHQARPPRGALAAKSSTGRRVSARARGRCGRARPS